VKGVIDIFAAGRVDRANFEVSQIPPASHLLWGGSPVFALRGQAVEHFLREWAHVNVELMQDHVRLSVDASFLADNFDELAKWEG